MVTGHSGGGFDKAYMHDSAGEGSFTGEPTRSLMQNTAYYHLASLFDTVMAYGHGGDGKATLKDSAGNDTFVHDAGWSSIYYGSNPYDGNVGDDNHYVRAHGFVDLEATATAGVDSAVLNGAAGEDQHLEAKFAQTNPARYASVTAADFVYQITAFDRADVIGDGDATDNDTDDIEAAVDWLFGTWQ